MTEQTSGPSAALSTEERLGGLLDAVVGLAGDLDLGSVLERIATVAGRLVGAEYAALAEPAPSGGCGSSSRTG